MISETKPADFHPRFSAVGIYLVHEGKILLLKYKTKYYGQWTIPSGKIEQGEDERDAAVRETFEETQVRLRPEELTYKYLAYARYPDNDFPWFVYTCELVDRPHIILSDEHSEYVWLTPTEALTIDLIGHEDWCIKKAFNLE